MKEIDGADIIADLSILPRASDKPIKEHPRFLAAQDRLRAFSKQINEEAVAFEIATRKALVWRKLHGQ